MATVLGQNWRPYQENNVVTPGFPEYVSGHSTFSAAGSLVLEQWPLGTAPRSAPRRTFKASSSKIDPGTPATDVVLSWNTLIDTSDDAGWSRRWGGIHFETGDLHGRGLGREVGINAWNKAQTYFDGTATATHITVLNDRSPGRNRNRPGPCQGPGRAWCGSR
jgi:hypothetical protein